MEAVRQLSGAAPPGEAHICHPGDLTCDATHGAIFLVMALAAGILSRTVLSATGLPYTVILLLLGGLLAGLDLIVTLGSLHDSINTWSAIDPHLMMQIFLPGLIFGSAFSVDYHIFRKEIGQMLLLAGPGVIMAVGLTATATMYLLPYDWDWFTALAFGAMLSATDPVAVVALLRELGASKRLSLLIEGESLLNDGTSMVVFIVFKESILTKHIDPLETMGTFGRLAIGGPIMGLVVGLIAYYTLKTIHFDSISEITVTVVACYGAFICSEGALGFTVSGVLAVVVLGLVLSSSARKVVTDYHHIHQFWEMLEYFANTLIFAVSGVVIVQQGFASNSIGVSDWGYMFLLYILLSIIRFLVVFSLYPILRRMGYGVTVKEAVVLSYSGLRGAVGLALALLLSTDAQILAHDERMAHLFVFHMAGIATLTLLVNGSTTGFLVEKLNITKASHASQHMFSMALKHIKSHNASLVTTLKRDEFYGDADWTRVDQVMSHLTESAANEELRHDPAHAVKSVAGAAKSLFKAASVAILHKKDNPDVQRLAAVVEEEDDDYYSDEDDEDVALVDAEDIVTVQTQSGSGASTFHACASFIGLHQMAARRSSLPEDGIDAAALGAAEEGQAGVGAGAGFGAGTASMTDTPSPAKPPSHIHSMIGFGSKVVPQPLIRAGTAHHVLSSLVAEGRHRFLNLVKAKVWDQYETGMLGSDGLSTLLSAASFAQDAPDLQLREWEYLQPEMKRTQLPRCMQQSNFGPLKALSRWYMFKPVMFEFDVATTFVRTHLEVEHVFEELVNNGTPEAKHVVQTVLGESRQSVKHARLRIQQICSGLPEVIRAVKTYEVIRSLLKESQTLAHELLHHGEIEEKEHGILSDALSELYRKVKMPKNIGLPTTSSMLESSGLTTGMTPATCKQLEGIGIERVYQSGQAIVTQGQPTTGFYLVLRGIVSMKRTFAMTGDTFEEENKSQRVTETGYKHYKTEPLHAEYYVDTKPKSIVKDGEAMNEIVLLDQMPQHSVLGAASMLVGQPELATVVCETDVDVLYFDESKIFKMIKSAPSSETQALRNVTPLEANICRMAGVNVAQLFLPQFKGMSAVDIGKIMWETVLIRPTAHSPLRFDGHAILLSGSLVEIDEEAAAQQQEVHVPTRLPPIQGGNAHGAASFKSGKELNSQPSADDDAASVFTVHTRSTIESGKMAYKTVQKAFSFLNAAPGEFRTFSPATRLLVLPPKYNSMFGENVEKWRQSASRIQKMLWASAGRIDTGGDEGLGAGGKGSLRSNLNSAMANQRASRHASMPDMVHRARARSKRINLGAASTRRLVIRNLNDPVNQLTTANRARRSRPAPMQAHSEHEGQEEGAAIPHAVTPTMATDNPVHASAAAAESKEAAS